MIRNLMDQERPCEGPKCREASAKIGQLQEKLREQLSPEGQALLEQLTDASFRRESALADDSFVEGLCTAVAIVLEVYTHLRPRDS